MPKRTTPPKAAPSHLAPTTVAPETASEPVRAGVTLLLAVYCFGLGLSVIGNSGSGASLLVRTIKTRIFTPVLMPAWLDLGFDYPLTYGLPEDADHVLELTPFAAPDTRRRFPAGLRGERANRWRRLARSIAESGTDGDRAARLAAGVAAASFDEFGPDVRVRVLRRVRSEVGAPDPGRLEEAYAARVREVGGEIQLIRAEAPGEVAPLVSPRRHSGATTEPAP